MNAMILWERPRARNTGLAFDLMKGQSVRITSQTIIDFVCSIVKICASASIRPGPKPTSERCS